MEVDELKKALEATTKERDDLKTQLEATTKERDGLKTQLDDAGTIVVDLKKRLATAEATPTVAGNPKFKIGQKTYEVLTPKIRLKGEEYTAAEVAKNKEVSAYLVEIESETVAEVK